MAAADVLPSPQPRRVRSPHSSVGIWLFTTYVGRLLFVADPLVLVPSLVLPAVTLVAIAMPGLVIRFVPRLGRWWIAHSGVAAAGVLLGVALLGFAYLGGFQESGELDGTRYSVRMPSWPPLWAGWFILAFFASHMWLPLRWGDHAMGPPDEPKSH